MPRIAFRLWLHPDPDGIETYVRGHLDPFPGLYDLIRGVGISRYTIWQAGADLLLTREGDDPSKGETLDMENPVHRQWADTMRPLFDERVAREGAAHPTEVFALDRDADPGPAQMTYRTGLRPGPDVMEAVADAHRTMRSDVVDSPRAAGIRRQWTWIEDGDAWTHLECDGPGRDRGHARGSGSVPGMVGLDGRSSRRPEPARRAPPDARSLPLRLMGAT